MRDPGSEVASHLGEGGVEILLVATCCGNWNKLQPDESLGPFSTCTNPIIHLFYPPKICIGIVLDYSWDMIMSQEKLQTMNMQNFWRVKEVHYGIVQVVNTKTSPLPYILPHAMFNSH